MWDPDSVTTPSGFYPPQNIFGSTSDVNIVMLYPVNMLRSHQASCTKCGHRKTAILAVSIKKKPRADNLPVMPIYLLSDVNADVQFHYLWNHFGRLYYL